MVQGLSCLFCVSVDCCVVNSRAQKWQHGNDKTVLQPLQAFGEETGRLAYLQNGFTNEGGSKEIPERHQEMAAADAT